MSARAFTVAEKRASILRELRYRRWVYSRRIADGKMIEADAEREIAIMEAILADYPDDQQEMVLR